jgi:phage-related protein
MPSGLMVASLFGTLELEDKLSPALDQAGKNLNGLGNSLGKTGSLLKGFSGLLGALPVIGFFTGAMSAASGAETAIAQLDAVLKSTKGAAHISKQALVELSDQLQKTTRYSKEQVISAENMLLTFTNVGGETFPRATKAIIDLSTAMRQDTKSSAIQLGKALNDPVNGITALTRVGVTFSKQQEQQIRQFVATGQVAKAQGVILKELETEFGGSAAAAGNTFAGALDILKNTFNELLITIGNAMLPILKAFAQGLTTLVSAINKVDPGIVSLVAGFGMLVVGFGPLMSIFGAVGAIISGPIVAIVVALGALGLAFSTNFGGIRTTVEGIVNAIKPAFNNIKDWVNQIKDVLTNGFNDNSGDDSRKGKMLGDQTIPSSTTLVQRVQKVISDSLPGLTAAIGSFTGVLSKQIGSLLSGAIQTVIDWLNNTGLPLLRDTIKSIFNVDVGAITFPSLDQIGTTINAVWNNVILPAFNTIRNDLPNILNTIRGILSGDIKIPVLDQLGATITFVWNRVIQPTLSSLVNGIQGFIINLSGANFSGVGNILATIGTAIGAFAVAIGGFAAGALGAIGDLLPRLGTALTSFVNAISALGNGDVGGILKGIGDGIKEIAGAAINIPLDIATRIGGFLGIDIKAGLKSWEGIRDNIGVIIDKLVASALQLGSDALNAIKKFGDEIGKALEPVAKAIEPIIKLFQSLLDAIGGIPGAMDKALNSMAPGSGNIQGALVGPQETGGYVAPSRPKAMGGNVNAGMGYKVGERGIEYFIPQTDGFIINNDILKGRNLGTSNNSANSGNVYNINNPIIQGVQDVDSLFDKLQQVASKRNLILTR